MRAGVIVLVAVAACGKGDDSRPAAPSAPPARSPPDARPAYDVPLADGALVTRAEQTAILRALQGTWRFPWIHSDSPAGATETVWHIEGDALTIVDGSRTRHGTVRVLAPCLLRMFDIGGIDGPQVPFLVEPDGVRFDADSIGRRTDGGWIACSAGGVVTIRGDACTATSFEWRTETVERAPVACEHGKRYDHDAWIFGSSNSSDILFVVGDELHDTLVPLAPPTRHE